MKVVDRNKILQLAMWDFFTFQLIFFAVAYVNADSILTMISSGEIWKIALFYAASSALAVAFITWRYSKDYADARRTEDSSGGQ